MTGGREGGSDYREGEGDKRAPTTEEGSSDYRGVEGDKGATTTEEGRETRGDRLQRTGGRQGG